MVTVAMLCTMVLDANLEKTRVLVCILKFIWNGGGRSHIRDVQRGRSEFRERKRMWVSCTECSVRAATSYLKTHMA